MIKDDDHCKEASEWMRMRRSTRCTTNKPTTNCSREEKRRLTIYSSETIN